MNRRLIVGERIMYADGQEPVNCVFSAKINGHLTLERLDTALSKIQKKHPLLRVNIHHEDKGQPSFVSNPEISEIPVQILARESDVHWETVCIAQWKVAFDVKRDPLARLVWLKSDQVSDLILVCPHCICDGMSLVTLLKEFLQTLDDPGVDLSPYVSFKSVEDLLPPSFVKSKRVRLKAKFFSLLAQGIFPIINKKRIGENGQFYLLNWALDREMSSVLVKKSKAENSSVQAVLCAAFLMAFRIVNGQQARNKVISPVDIRRYIPEIKKDNMFAFAPIVELSLNKASVSESFWNETRKIKDDLASKTGRINMSEIIIISEYFHSSAKHMIRHLRSTKGSHDVTLSNMGVLDIPVHYKTFSVDTIHSPAVGFPWRNPNTLVASTFSGRMDFSFCSNESFLSLEKAMLVRDKAMSLLREETTKL